MSIRNFTSCIGSQVISLKVLVRDFLTLDLKLNVNTGYSRALIIGELYFPSIGCTGVDSCILLLVITYIYHHTFNVLE